MRRRVIPSVLVCALAVAACSGSEDGASSPSTTEGPTTTEASPGEVLCGVLEQEPYEARKEALRDAGAVADDAPCASMVDGLEEVIALEDRAAGLPPEGVEVTLTCDNRTVFPKLVSQVDEPVGFAGALARYPTGAPEDPSRLGTGFVVWRIDAGATVETERGLGGMDTGTCGANGQIFLVEEREVDASLPGERADDDQASDDPDVWFSALVEAEEEWQRASDPDGVARTEDLRSPGYGDLVESAADGPSPTIDREAAYTICVPYEGPDEDHVGLLYRVDLGAFSFTDDDGSTVDLPAESVTRFGAFRRGADGRWRWLMTSSFVYPRGCKSPVEFLLELVDSGLIALPEGIDPADVTDLSDDELQELLAELGQSAP